MRALYLVSRAVIALAATLIITQCAGKHMSDRERLIGAWHLVRINTPGIQESAQPLGMLVYSRDGHVSVQLMYPVAQHALNNQYVRDGYEASFGSFTLNDSTHTLTHHIQGANTGDLLVGKDLPRVYQFTGDGHLLIRSARNDEHWSVLWERY